jgi:hypothetical protein
MTRERDIERVLDTWLADGSTQMPDRLYVAVLHRVDRTPQRRLARLKLRFSEMRPAIRIAAVAAVLLLTLGVGAAVVGGAFDTDVAGPTPEPSPAVSPSPAASPSPSPAAALPDELAHIWIGGEQAVPAVGITTPALRTLQFDPELGFARYVAASLDLGPSMLASEPSVPFDGRLRLTTAAADFGACEIGSVGDYDYRLSGDGMTLTLTPVSDDCQARAEVFAGTFTRSACKNPDDYCLGDLPPGTFVSTFLDPYRAPDVRPARGDFGRLRYTVPDGWANSGDWPSNFALEPADIVAGNPASGDPTTWHGIYVRTRAAAAVQDDQCTDAEQPGVPRTLDGLTAFLQERPGLVASAPTELTIGGYRATMTDISIAADWTATCPDAPGGHPVVTLFREADEPVGQGWVWGIGWPGNTDRQRLVLVELSPDNVLLIGIEDTSSPSRFDELIAEAMPIVESLEFPD